METPIAGIGTMGFICGAQKIWKKWEPRGRIWSFDKDAAAWQRKGKSVKLGSKSVNGDPLDSIYRAVCWAQEIHCLLNWKSGNVLVK